MGQGITRVSPAQPCVPGGSWASLPLNVYEKSRGREKEREKEIRRVAIKRDKALE